MDLSNIDHSHKLRKKNRNSIQRQARGDIVKVSERKNITCTIKH